MNKAIIFSSFPSLPILCIVASDFSKVVFQREMWLGVKGIIYGRWLCHLAMKPLRNRWLFVSLESCDLPDL